MFPAHSMEFFARDVDGDVLWFAPVNRYHGAPADVPDAWRPLLDAERGETALGPRFLATDGDSPAIAMALYSPDIPRSTGIAVLHLDSPVELHESTRVALERLGEPLEVALEREVLQRTLEAQRSRFHELAMHDALTGLANRLAIGDVVPRLFALQDRGELPGIALTTFDVDLFKQVNDRFGHPTGDQVLRRIARTLRQSIRLSDLAAAPAARSSPCTTCSGPTNPPRRWRTASARLSRPCASRSCRTTSRCTSPQEWPAGTRARASRRSPPAPMRRCTRRRRAGAIAPCSRLTTGRRLPGVRPPAVDSELLVIGVASPYVWEVVESARHAGHSVRCVDNHGDADPRLPGLTTLGPATNRAHAFTIGLSSAAHRSAALAAVAADGFIRPVPLVDPTAAVASTAVLGHATYVNAGAVVASNTALGCAVNVNRSASIGHDNRIDWGTSVGPGVTTGGGVGVGARTSLGVGAVVLPGITIGPDCTIGAGAVVIDDVAPGSVVVGNPATLVRTSALTEATRCPYC